MPDAKFFQQLGLYAVKNFLDRDFCADLLREMEVSPRRKGSFVSPETNREVVDETVKKRAEVTKMPERFEEKVRTKLLGIKDDLANHYQLELNDIQPPKFSIYDKGDFYKAHRDKDVKESASDFLKERKVSSIVFLNEEFLFEKEGSYCGGNLTFYGLMEDKAFGSFGLPLVSEPGMLITFLPTLLHEVTPVTEGRRFTIASWYI